MIILFSHPADYAGSRAAACGILRAIVRYSSVFEAAEDREDTGVRDGIWDWTHAAAIQPVITLVITTDGTVITPPVITRVGLGHGFQTEVTL